MWHVNWIATVCKELGIWEGRKQAKSCHRTASIWNETVNKYICKIHSMPDDDQYYINYRAQEGDRACVLGGGLVEPLCSREVDWEQTLQRFSPRTNRGDLERRDLGPSLHSCWLPLTQLGSQWKKDLRKKSCLFQPLSFAYEAWTMARALRPLGSALHQPQV